MFELYNLKCVDTEHTCFSIGHTYLHFQTEFATQIKPYYWRTSKLKQTI